MRGAIKPKIGSGGGIDFGIRMLGSFDSKVRTQAYTEISGEIAAGLTGFVDAEVEINDSLDWQATTGLKWRW